MAYISLGVILILLIGANNTDLAYKFVSRAIDGIIGINLVYYLYHFLNGIDINIYEGDNINVDNDGVNNDE